MFPNIQLLISTHENSFAGYIGYKYKKYSLPVQRCNLKEISTTWYGIVLNPYIVTWKGNVSTIIILATMQEPRWKRLIYRDILDKRKSANCEVNRIG